CMSLAPGGALPSEPMFNAGGAEVVLSASDGWTARTRDGSLSAHFEISVAVTADGPMRLGRGGGGGGGGAQRRGGGGSRGTGRGGSARRWWARRRGTNGGAWRRKRRSRSRRRSSSRFRTP